jgi:hypothetical protein
MEHRAGIDSIPGVATLENPRHWHEVLDQEDGVEVWAHAPTWSRLIEEMGRTLGEQLVRSPVSMTPRGGRILSVHASGRAALLAALVNEILYHAEGEWWVPVEFSVLTASDSEIRARVREVRLGGPPRPLRALSAEDVRIRSRPAGLEVETRLVG